MFSSTSDDLMRTPSQIIPIEDTFFLRVELPERLKLLPSMVKANYISRSPFQGGDLIYQQDNRQLNLWFTRKPLSGGWKIPIPEAHLVCRTHSGQEDVVLVLSKQQASAYLVKKNGMMMAQVVTNAAESEVVELLSREHSLHQPRVVRIDGPLRTRVNIADLRNFCHYDFDTSDILSRGLAFAKLPMIIGLSVMIVFQLYSQQFLHQTVLQKQTQLRELKQANATFKQQLRQIENEANFWSNFQRQEYSQTTFLTILGAASQAVSSVDGYLKNLNFAGNELNFWAGIKDAPTELVDRLLDSGYFSSVKVISSRQDNRQPDTELVQLQLITKENVVSEKTGVSYAR